MVDRGGIDFSLETAACKVFASELVNRAANEAPVRITSTVPSCRPWLMSLSLPRLEAGKTWISYLPFVRFLNSSAAQTDQRW